MRATWIVGLFACLSTRALGAYALFEPSGEVVLPIGTPSVSVDVTVVGETLTQMQGIDLLLSWSPAVPSDWHYSMSAPSAFTTLTGFSFCNSSGCDGSVLVGGSRLNGSVPANLLLGTLTLDTSSFDEIATLRLGIDRDIDLGLSNVLLGAQSELIRPTSATFRFVPEPGTLAMFAVAAWIVVARRRWGFIRA